MPPKKAKPKKRKVIKKPIPTPPLSGEIAAGDGVIEKKKLTKAQAEALLRVKQAELDALNEKRKLYDAEEKKYDAIINKYEEDNKILFFNHPDKGHLGPYGTWKNNHAQDLIIKAVEEAKYKLISLTGDNQIGKTLMETIMVIAFMRGHWPWEDPKMVGQHLWDKFGFKPPIHIRWIGAGWEDHIKRTLLNEGLDVFWPKSWPVKKKKNNQGVDYHWVDETTGSYLYLMSSDQDVVKFAGSKCDLVIFDEPFPKTIWDENVARIIAKGGFIFIGATIHEEDDLWLYDEILDMEIDSATKKEKIFHLEAAAKVNMGHGTIKKNVADAAFLMTKEGRAKRLEGSKLKSFGRVIRYDELNLTERIDIPPHWMHIAAVDIGVSKPHDVLFMGFDEMERRYFTFEFEVNGNGNDIGEKIIDTMHAHKLRLQEVIIDPLAKAAQFHEDSIYWQLDMYLRKFGIRLSCGSKRKEDGVIQLNKLFKGRIDKFPDLLIFDDLYKTKAQLKIRFDKEGRIPKKNDDQFENGYRLALCQIDYYDPVDEDAVREMNTGGSILSGTDAGY